MEQRIDRWRLELTQNARQEKIKILSSFFKTGKGGYGEGDEFIGLSVPANRAISRQYHDMPEDCISSMLKSEIHEFRLAALLALTERYRRSRKDESAQKAIAEFYLAHTRWINNWDLVDLSAPSILGEYVAATGDDAILYRLSHSASMWEQRIAIVATLTLIRKGQFDTTMALAEAYLTHSHDLIHKATGWMLREVGKRDENRLRTFLDTHTTHMPRTALRYAIEKLDADSRKHYMTLK